MNTFRTHAIGAAVISTLCLLTGCTFGNSHNAPAPIVKPIANPEQNQPGDNTANTPVDSNQTGSAAVDQSKPLDTEKNYAGTTVELISQTEGWIGGKGFILHSKDAGQQWRIQYEGPYEFTSIAFIDPSHGWALGRDMNPTASNTDHRILLKTADGGNSWDLISELKGIDEIQFQSAQRGMAGTLMTIDGGKTWAPVNVPSHLKGYPYFADSTHGWAVTATETEFQINKTDDGGISWNPVFNRPLNSPITGAVIRAAQPNDVWAMAVGSSGMTQTSYSLFHSADNGKNWTPVLVHSTAGGGPAPGFSMNDSGMKGPGSKPGILDVVNNQTVYLSGNCPACGNEGTVTIGKTLDSGKSWVNMSQQIPGQSGSISFIDPDHGWLIVTQMGRISVLYVTQDGGKTWKSKFTFGS